MSVSIIFVLNSVDLNISAENSFGELKRTAGKFIIFMEMAGRGGPFSMDTVSLTSHSLMVGK